MPRLIINEAINYLRSTDDAVLIADDPGDLPNLVKNVNSKLKVCGLDINI